MRYRLLLYGVRGEGITNDLVFSFNPFATAIKNKTKPFHIKWDVFVKRE